LSPRHLGAGLFSSFRVSGTIDRQLRCDYDARSSANRESWKPCGIVCGNLLVLPVSGVAFIWESGRGFSRFIDDRSLGEFCPASSRIAVRLPGLISRRRGSPLDDGVTSGNLICALREPRFPATCVSKRVRARARARQYSVFRFRSGLRAVIRRSTRARHVARRINYASADASVVVLVRRGSGKEDTSVVGARAAGTFLSSFP
jgi:hypothetical protein